MQASKVIEAVESCRYSFIDEFDKSSATHILVIKSKPVDRVACQRALRSLVIKNLAAEGITLADDTSLYLEKLDEATATRTA